MSAETILIVEDERAVARGLIYGLRDAGFTPVWAETGLQAQELARQQPPHIILLDIRLPDASGFDLCRQWRAQGLKQPILILTARDEEMDKILGLEMGADDYVVKPYSLRELISRSGGILRRAYADLASTGSAPAIHYGNILVNYDHLTVT
ncbi:MAG: response regulator, partial [Litorilinea sp.]